MLSMKVTDIISGDCPIPLSMIAKYKPLFISCDVASGDDLPELSDEELLAITPQRMYEDLKERGCMMGDSVAFRYKGNTIVEYIMADISRYDEIKFTTHAFTDNTLENLLLTDRKYSLSAYNYGDNSVKIHNKRGSVHTEYKIENGRITSLISHLKDEVIFVYDEDNRTVTINDNDGEDFIIYFDEDGNIIKTFTYGSYNHVIQYFMYEDGRLSQVISVNDYQRIVSYKCHYNN